MELDAAIRAEQAADKAVQAYDAYVFGSVGRAFDAFRADQLAATAADLLTIAARLTTRVGCNGSMFSQRAAEFRAIAEAA